MELVGGHLALDLANTVEPRVPGAIERDHLSSPAALAEWALRAGVTKELTEVSEEAFADTLTIRALIDPVLEGRDLDALMFRWSLAISRSALVPADGGVALRVGVEPSSAIPDRLADALVDLVRNADLTRLKACPPGEGGCGWLFLDRSRNGTRRWCSMGDCGSRVKARRLTERRKNFRETSWHSAGDSAKK
jgi:predicted RNA-binding Zn ribbon-like protein